MYPTINKKQPSFNNLSYNSSERKTSYNSLKSLKQSRNFISPSKLLLNKKQPINLDTLLSHLSTKPIVINKSKSEYNCSKIINKRFNNSKFSSNNSSILYPKKSSFYSNILNQSLNKINMIKKTNNDNNKNDLLLITSLYVLPSLKKKKQLSKAMSQKQLNVSVISNNITLNNSTILSNKDLNRSCSSDNKDNNNSLINNKNINSKPKIENSPKDEYSNLASYMKEKFYSDIDRKYNHKLKDSAFIHDYSIKEKIIKMRKVGIFWNRVLEYCSPIIYSEKYKFQRSEMNYRKKLKYLKQIKNDT